LTDCYGVDYPCVSFHLVVLFVRLEVHVGMRIQIFVL